MPSEIQCRQKHQPKYFQCLSENQYSLGELGLGGTTSGLKQSLLAKCSLGGNQGIKMLWLLHTLLAVTVKHDI